MLGKPLLSKLFSIENRLKRIKITSNFASLNNVKIAGNLINQGFPFSVLAVFSVDEIPSSSLGEYETFSVNRC